MDRRFEGLLFSLVFHALLAWALFILPAAPPPVAAERVEIDFAGPAPRPRAADKQKSFIEETEIDPKPAADLKETADFLSRFTKRVKKQLVARENGPTRNARPNLVPRSHVDLEPKARPRPAGGAAAAPPAAARGAAPERAESERGETAPPSAGGDRAVHQMAAAPSSIAEYVPGLEAGEFTALNTDQFTYYAFFARINEQIRNRWVASVRAYVARLGAAEQNELSKSDRQTVVEIILGEDGAYDTKIVENSSGDPRLDQTTVDAFVAAAPFLNPPAGLIGNDRRIHLKYGFLVRFRPPYPGGL